MLLGVSEAEAAAVAEEITGAIADAHIGLNEHPVSGAIGWATLREDESPRELLARADDEMYHRKRNRARVLTS